MVPIASRSRLASGCSYTLSENVQAIFFELTYLSRRCSAKKIFTTDEVMFVVIFVLWIQFSQEQKTT